MVSYSQDCDLQLRKASSLAQMLLTAKADRDAAEDARKRLEIRFSRSDKGSAMLRSTKLKQDLERSTGELQAAKLRLCAQVGCSQQCLPTTKAESQGFATLRSNSWSKKETNDSRDQCVCGRSTL